MKKRFLILSILFYGIVGYSQWLPGVVAESGGVIPTEVRTYIFSAPTSTGNTNFQIPGWTVTPKAVKFIIVGTDATGDGFDDHNLIGEGFTDGVNEYGITSSAQDGAATSRTSKKMSSTGCVFVQDFESTPGELATANFTAWLSGGVQLNFTTAPAIEYKIIATFFAGDAISVYAGDASPGDHVTSVGFESNLIFTLTIGGNLPTTASGAGYVHSSGIATWDESTLKQGWIGSEWDDGNTNSQADFYVSTDSASGQIINSSIWWQSSIANVDALGWNFTNTDADDILFLAVDLDVDVDMGVVTVPTSGDISVTTPGWTPQFLGLFLTNHTATNTLATTIDASYGIGEVDATSEHSLSVTGENAATANHTSVRNTDVLHLEQADNTTIYNGSFDSFTANGFDITVNTNPASAMYYIWWAID